MIGRLCPWLDRSSLCSGIPLPKAHAAPVRRRTRFRCPQQSPVPAGLFIHRAAIALGSNIDSADASRADHLHAALAALNDPPGTRVLARSDFIQTAPVGPIPQDQYLNAAAILETTLTPEALLARLLDIERTRGRDRAREGRWGPRTLDLDLLLFDDLIVDQPGLTIPHPRLTERAFVLIPLAQIAPSWIVPGEAASGRSVAQLLAALPTESESRP